jgi:Helicase conserved C-terminal domain/SNF2-related domain
VVTSVPEVGQAVRVRNRLATVRAVEPYEDQHTGETHSMVEVEYLDDNRHPEIDQILWEVEATAQTLGATPLPPVDEHPPDSPGALRAFLDAHRWTRLNRLRAEATIDDEPLMGVWNSAIQVHPYQIVPVIRALEMPRVSLLLADSVGLGKTIQAGLTLEEMILRRRIRRVLIVCPAVLQRQWKAELQRKFNIDFEIVDSDSTFALRRRMGIDTNPWRAFPRIITSMDYLRLPDIRQQFLLASGVGDDGSGEPRVHAPWDLLIVDEAAHFAPTTTRGASLRTHMMREIRFLFEHRIFLSATPHNGKTISFTGLLELLDPVRFQMSGRMDDDDRRRLGEVRVRRLKDDINRVSFRPPFADLDIEEIPLGFSQKERDLFDALRRYRDDGLTLMRSHRSSPEVWVARFLFSLLTKRLLSCPFAFARTWWRHLEKTGFIEKDLFTMARTAANRAEEIAGNDDEKSQAEEDAARLAGAWMDKSGETDLATLQVCVNRALDALGLGQEVLDDDKIPGFAKRGDSKTEALLAWVKANLRRPDGTLRDDERLIVFTEYKETLRYLEERFKQEGFDENTMSLLYGGMSLSQFENVQQDFEDTESAVRLLLATDAASEGINMQEACRWVIHMDVPWSPSKLIQRNGRVSRHGQVRDVKAHYFRSNEDADIEFFYMIANKVKQVQDDLGSVEKVLDAAIQRHFAGQSLTEGEIDTAISQARESSQELKDLGHETTDEVEHLTERAQRLLDNTDTKLGVTPDALVNILRAAIQIEGGGNLEEIERRPGFHRLRPPPRWETLAKQTLRVGKTNDRMELVFDNALVEEECNGRRVLRLKRHQTLMRLGHPIMRQAMATLRRMLHDPSGNDPIRRWSLAAINWPNFEPVLILHAAVTATNELRETVHDEQFSVVFHLSGDKIKPAVSDQQDRLLRETLLPVKSSKRREDWTRTVRTKWVKHREAIDRFTKTQVEKWRTQIEQAASATLDREKADTSVSYKHRLKELADRTREREMGKMLRELAKAEVEAASGFLFADMEVEAEAKLVDIEKEVELLRRDTEHTRVQLERERDHRLKKVLPQRYTIRDVRVIPLAVEYVIPADKEDLI